MSPDTPIQVKQQRQRADTLQMEFIQSGVSKGRRARNLPTGSLMITAPMSKDGRVNPVIMRQLGIVTKAIKVRSGKGNKPDLQLLFELAEWFNKVRHQGLPLPRRSLAKYMNEELLSVLQRFGQVDTSILWWDEMQKEALRLLEKRLYHYWKPIDSIASALKVPTDRATNMRRKQKTCFQHVVCQLMARPNS